MRKDQPRGRITTKVTAWTENGSDALWCLRSRVSISSSALQGWVDKPLTKLRSGVKGRYGPLTPGVCNSSAGQAISLQPPLLFAGALAPPWICPGTHILQSLRDCKTSRLERTSEETQFHLLGLHEFPKHTVSGLLNFRIRHFSFGLFENLV